MAVQTQDQIMKAQRAATELGVTIPDTINSADLTRNTTTPKVTPTAPSTAGAGLAGAIQSSQDQFTQTMLERKKDAQTNKDKAANDYTTRLFETPTQSELQADKYASEGVDDTQKELDDINSQIQVEDHALQREIERIRDNAVGASMGQVENMVNEAENRSLRKRADLSVIQMGLQGKYKTAKAIADRAVDAELEREEKVIEALKINYEDNKALFTTAEQREFDTLLSNRQNAYEEEKANKKAISDYAIEAMKMGASGEIITSIRSAKTPEEAQALAAEYISPIISGEREMERQAFGMDMQLKQVQIQAAKSQMQRERLAPTDVIEQDGRKLLINTQTGAVLKDFGAATESIGELKTAMAKDFISTVDSLKTDKGLSRSVGSYGISRFTPFTADKAAVNNFTASVEQMGKTLTLDSLVNAKARGATFGALSNAELQLLAQSSTKINTWARTADGKRPDPEKGDITHHYEVSEKLFKQELDRISNFGKLDYVLKGGNAADVGVEKMDDGTYWVKNSDGSFTKIR